MKETTALGAVNTDEPKAVKARAKANSSARTIGANIRVRAKIGIAELFAHFS